MKIAVIGNSHAGMLRAASLSEEFSAVDFDWLVKPGSGLERIVVEGCRLFANDHSMQSYLLSMGMETEIDLREYDAAVFAGRTISTLDVAYISRDYVIVDWVDSDTVDGILMQVSNRWSNVQFITENAFSDTLLNMIKQGFTHQAVSVVSQYCATPVFVVPQPFLSQKVLLPEVKKHKVFRKISKLNCFPELAELLHRAHHAAFADFPNVTLLQQDNATIFNSLFSKDEYCRNSLRAATLEERVEEDYLHANGEFGKIVLEKIVNAAR